MKRQLQRSDADVKVMLRRARGEQETGGEANRTFHVSGVVRVHVLFFYLFNQFSFPMVVLFFGPRVKSTLEWLQRRRGFSAGLLTRLFTEGGSASTVCLNTARRNMLLRVHNELKRLKTRTPVCQSTMWPCSRQTLDKQEFTALTGRPCLMFNSDSRDL